MLFYGRDLEAAIAGRPDNRGEGFESIGFLSNRGTHFTLSKLADQAQKQPYELFRDPTHTRNRGAPFIVGACRGIGSSYTYQTPFFWSDELSSGRGFRRGPFRYIAEAFPSMSATTLPLSIETAHPAGPSRIPSACRVSAFSRLDHDGHGRHCQH